MSIIFTIKRSLLILLPFLVVSPAQADNRTVPFKICYENVPQPPYYYGNSTSIPLENPGIYIEISNFIAQELNLTVSHIRAPWKRCLALLRENSVDGLYGASFKENRLLDGRYPMKKGILDKERRIVTKSYSLYKNKDAEINWDGKTLTNASAIIGAPLGYSIVPFLRGHGADVETRWSTELGLSLVSMGRISSFAAQDPTADAFLENEPERFENVVKVFPTLQDKSYFMMISHMFYEKETEISEDIWNKISFFRTHRLPDLLKAYPK
ncbi:MAG: transporter substrate-binding domain-containing protein [Sneathiella sp.]